MDSKSIIYGLYKIFSKGISSKPFVWEPNDKSDKVVERFFERFQNRGVHRDSMGIVFLYDYFCDSYNCWTRGGEKMEAVPLNWIIGAKQLERWDNKIEEYKFSYSRGLLSKADIPTLTELKKEFREKEDRGLDVSEEYDRQRFHNTAEGFVNCLLTTSLCSLKSGWCNSCTNREDCIEELKIRDKRTALLRGFIKL